MEKTTTKRRFREVSKDQQNLDASISAESRSPSPALPSRLDRIPSPSTLQQDNVDEKKSPNKSNERRESVDESKRSKQKSPKRRRSKSRSPRRKNSRSRSPRRKKSRTPPRKGRKSRSRSREKRRRSRSGSKDRRRRSRSRDRRRRSRSRDRRRSSRDRRRSRSPRRRRFSRSRSPSPQFTSKWGMKRTDITRAVVKENGGKKAALSTEEVEARVAQHMKGVAAKAQEEAKNINLPGYLNPAMVNLHQFKQVQDKRKLLWSKTKDKKEGATQYGSAVGDEKFKRLMGLQGVDVETDESKVEKSRQVLDDLETQYEKSRAFQLSRGSGGVTGMGLGFGSYSGTS